jgi:hypothetical protein
MSKHDNDNVGYKKPPKKNQFKPGQSGNPAGKPKGSHDLQRALAKALGETIIVNTPSGKQRVTLAQMLVRKGISEVSKGNMRAFEVLFKVLAKAAAANDPAPIGDTAGDPDDDEILAAYNRKILSEKK